MDNRFEVRSVLGHDAGSVSLAWDAQLGRMVALKRHHATPSSEGRVRALLAIRPHPNLALVRHEFRDGDDHVLVIDYIDGPDLATPLSVEDIVHCAADVGAALDHLHAHGFAHGDVKAANVIVTRDAGGRPRATLVDVALSDGRKISPARDFEALAALVEQLLATAGISIAGVPKLRSLVVRGHATRTRRRVRAATAAAVALVAMSVPALDHATPDTVVAPTRAVLRNATAADATEPDDVTPPVGEVALGTITSLAAAPESPAARPSLTAARPVTPHHTRLGVYQHGLKSGSGEWPAWEYVYTLDGPVPTLQNGTYGLGPLPPLVAPLGDDWLYFYSPLEGRAGTAPIEPDGRLGVGGNPTPPALFTHMVGDGYGMVWFYRSDTGLAATANCVDGRNCVDHPHPNTLPATYDRLTALGRNRVLLYQSSSGDAIVATVSADGRNVSLEPTQLPAGFAMLVRTGTKLLVGLGTDGTATMLRLDGIKATTVKQFSVGGSLWDAGVGFDDGFIAYNSLGLSSVVVHLNDDGSARSIAPWTLPLEPVLVDIQ